MTFILMVVVFIVVIFGLTPLCTPTSLIPVTAVLSPGTRTSEPSIFPLSTSPTEIISLDEFISSVTETKTNYLTGVYVPDEFAFPVLQQPPDSPGYVSIRDGVVTQFSIPGEYGSIGLLAHSFLGGEKFFDLREGMEITLIYGNGNVNYYRVKKTERYRALTSQNVHSDFVDMSDTSAPHLDSTQLFNHIYGVRNRLIFQTCITDENNNSVGRLFVIAEKIDR
jgi:hypothetical protein